MKFYLGTLSAMWLERTTVPIFLSRRAMPRKKLHSATCDWALDSGGYSELHMNGGWNVMLADYAAEIKRWQENVGRLDWAAPMDWMCEPSVRAKTGLSVKEHQLRTIGNFIELRERLGSVVIPVLQGWAPGEYEDCIELYGQHGIDLWEEPVIGLGSVCRRGEDTEIGRILRRLGDELQLKIHAFGVRGKTLQAHAEVLTSADSLAWSYRARAARQYQNREVSALWCCGEGKSCRDCLQYALRWRSRLLDPLAQMQLDLR